jgi:tetratricopeptide (TPR) repeat protein
MFRATSRTLFVIAFLSFTMIAAADPPEDADARLSKALSVQTAMVRARSFLTDQKAQKAVEILEDHLPKVNGNPEYLVLLRDAYRTYVKDLLGAGQFDQAKRYLDRLCILDPSAANDPALRPHVEAPPRKFEPDAAPPKVEKILKWTMPTLLNPFAKREEPKKPPLIVRGQSDDTITEDPFDRKNQREMVPTSSKATSARDLLARGVEEFKLKRYPEARVSFEMAYQADNTCLDTPCRDQWAYCIIACVNDAMKQPGAKFAELKQQVEGAIGMAPAKVMATGQELLQELDRRAGSARSSSPIAISAVNIRHLGESADGWFVAETANFRIFHRQDKEFAERVAQVAEGTRRTMYRKWFGHDGIEWQPIDSKGPAGCQLILHANAASYTQMTGVPSNSPGHSKIESDMSGRVLSRRMDMRLDLHGMTETVLPHETTHVVLAGMFGSAPVPRWADEGMAVLSEPEEKIGQHRGNLVKHQKEEPLFGLRELMELKDYPQPRRISMFYAQSVVLVEFLAKERGPKVFTDFVKDGLRSGYEPALRRHYNMTFAELDQAWQKHLNTNLQRLASQK